MSVNDQEVIVIGEAKGYEPRIRAICRELLLRRRECEAAREMRKKARLTTQCHGHGWFEDEWVVSQAEMVVYDAARKLTDEMEGK